MSEWQPATAVEAAMVEALAASDQDQYFRILARSELILPVSADVLAGRAPMGWGTWTIGNRTHVLAFTSPAALATCLSDPGGSYRTVSFQALAAEWPNFEWWLAVNPGLPIEAYLPSWFVAQLVRGDVRVPGRNASVRSRMAASELAAALSGRVRATAAAAEAARQRVTAEPHYGISGRDGHLPAVETVEAEIIDDPTPTARVSVQPTDAPARHRSAEEPAEYGSAAAPGEHRSGAGWFSAGVSAEPAALPSATTRATARVVSSSSPWVASDTGYATKLPTEDSKLSRPDLDKPPRKCEPEDAEIVEPGEDWTSSFVPANDTEASLLAAAKENNTDAFLSTLLLARVLVPVPAGTPETARPRDPSFPWRINEVDGQRYISVFTSPERLEESASRYGGDTSSVNVRFVQLIASWPDEQISFAVNPGTPVGATLPGSQIVALASWATEVGLRDTPDIATAQAAQKQGQHKQGQQKRGGVTSGPSVAGAPAARADRPTMMQRCIPHAQVSYYLERGYDRVSGFVNRASEVAHLTTPKQLYRALGLIYSGSPFSEDDPEVHVLRWPAYRPNLYRIPYGGQHEAAMRAMQGWVIERAPFRGNSFAPGDTKDVIAEFKVDSIRLPHGAQIWRYGSDGSQTLIATFDADTSRWVRSIGGGARA